MLRHGQGQAGVGCEIDGTGVVDQIFLFIRIMCRIFAQDRVHGDMVPRAVAQRLDQRDAAALTQGRGNFLRVVLPSLITFAT